MGFPDVSSSLGPRVRFNRQTEFLLREQLRSEVIHQGLWNLYFSWARPHFVKHIQEIIFRGNDWCRTKVWFKEAIFEQTRMQTGTDLKEQR